MLQVASFADDDGDFWKNIIPASEIPTSDLPNRKRKRGFDEKDDDYEEHDDKRACLDRETSLRRSRRGGDEDGLMVLEVDVKEVRRIVNCIKVCVAILLFV